MPPELAFPPANFVLTEMGSTLGGPGAMISDNSKIGIILDCFHGFELLLESRKPSVSFERAFDMREVQFRAAWQRLAINGGPTADKYLPSVGKRGQRVQILQSSNSGMLESGST